MHSEIILYGYAMVCLSMLVFNMVYSAYMKSGQRHLERTSEILAREVDAQLARIRDGQEITIDHSAMMGRTLARVGNLLAFDKMLQAHDSEKDIRERYLHQLEPTLLQLAAVYREREDMQAAYYCHFLATHLQIIHGEMNAFQRAVMAYFDKPGLYCRVNALRALCAFGSAQSVVEAVTLLHERQGAQLHNKVLVEVLLTFQGDNSQLIAGLWQCFDRFSATTQRAVLDYIRFCSDEYQAVMLAILEDEHQDKELRLSAIRYLGKYPYEPAREILKRMASDRDVQHWEYAAASAGALARYEGRDVGKVLVIALRSHHWHVRYNAAASLEGRGASYEDLLLAAGDDRYALEMIAYRMKWVEDKEPVS